MLMNRREQRIHISEIDEFLAGSLAAGHMGPFRVSISKYGDQGYLKALLVESDEFFEDDGVDFELSPGENRDLDELEVRDFVMKAVYTSSAYGLFDYIFTHFSSIECVVDFKESAWLVKVVNTD